MNSFGLVIWLMISLGFIGKMPVFLYADSIFFFEKACCHVGQKTDQNCRLVSDTILRLSCINLFSPLV